jgi:hypothetical protein
MKKIKTYAASAMALGGLFLIGSLMRSRDSQAKGAYSTPVTVMNTNAQPGSVLDAERATRIPYQSDVTLTNCFSQCVFQFSTPPAGYRLVVENVSGFLELDPSSAAPAGDLQNLHLPHNNLWGLNAPLGPNAFGVVTSGLNQTVRAIFDPGDLPRVVIFATFLPGSPQYATLSGYLENCALTGCPAVQH